MKLPRHPGLFLALLALAVPAFAQNPAQAEIISASTMIALGRPAGAAELGNPAFASKSLPDLIAAHRESLKADPALNQRVSEQARWDVTGTKAGSAGKAGGTYAELMQTGIAALAANPKEYHQVINRAYQLVIRRDAYPEEIEYWQRYGTLPYVVLVGAIENWAFRNQPGLMVTTGTPSIAINSRFLRTQRLSLAVANEARTVLGLPVWTDVARQHSPGRNIVAVGAKDIESVGGVHFLLAGGGPLAGN